MKRKIVIFGPSGSGKTTFGVGQMIHGNTVFDSDFIYAMYKIRINDETSEQDAWDLVLKRFCELYEAGAMVAVDIVLTADSRIAEYLLGKGFLRRNLSKRFVTSDPSNRRFVS